MSRLRSGQGGTPADTAPGTDRRAREGAALRANLLKRKAQARARALGPPAGDAAEPAADTAENGAERPPPAD